MVRLASITALLSLYSNPDNGASLADFTHRFAQRFGELFYDVDERVAVRGVRRVAGRVGGRVGERVGERVAVRGVSGAACISGGWEEGALGLRFVAAHCWSSGSLVPLTTGAPHTHPPTHPPTRRALPAAPSPPQVQLNTLLVRLKEAQPSQFARVYELLADESHALRHAVAELVASALEEQGQQVLQVRGGGRAPGEASGGWGLGKVLAGACPLCQPVPASACVPLLPAACQAAPRACWVAPPAPLAAAAPPPRPAGGRGQQVGGQAAASQERGGPRGQHRGAAAGGGAAGALHGGAAGPACRHAG